MGKYPVYIYSMQQQQTITEEQLDAIYKYLAITYDQMDDKDQKFWTALLMEHDPDFDDIEIEEND